MPEIEIPEKKTPEEVEVPADWKTYRNKEYGFEMRYPNDWIIGVGDTTSDVIHWRTSD